MKASRLHLNLIDSYFGLLKNLSSDSKLELIAKLSDSMKTSRRTKNGSLKSLYGAFISKQSADELIRDIKQARTFITLINKLNKLELRIALFPRLQLPN